MAEPIKCPRCGAENQTGPVCANCKLNIAKYLELLKRHRESAGGQPAPVQQPGTEAPAKAEPATPAPVQSQRPAPRRPASRPVPPPVGLPGFSEPGASEEPSPELMAYLEQQGRSLELYPYTVFFGVVLDIFVSRIWVFLSLMVMAALMFLVPLSALALMGQFFSGLAGSKGKLVLGFFEVTGGLIGIYMLLAGLAAIACAADNDTLSIRDSLGRGFRRALGFGWTLIVTLFIIGGGALLFFLPGLLASVWFLMAPNIFVTENVAGMRAVLKSKAYAEGLSVDIFFRLLILCFLGLMAAIIPGVGPYVFVALFIPFAFTYMSQMYRNVLELKGNRIDYEIELSEKLKWAFAGMASYAIAGTVFLLFAAPSTVGEVRTSIYELKARWGLASAAHDYEKIKGAWAGSSTEGRAGYHFTFRNGILTTRYDGIVIYEGSFALNQYTKPRLIDVLIEFAPSREQLGLGIPGAYSIAEDGQAMTLCLRPPGAVSSPESLEKDDLTTCFNLVRAEEVSEELPPPPPQYSGAIKLNEDMVEIGAVVTLHYEVDKAAVGSAWVGLFEDTPSASMVAPLTTLTKASGDLPFAAPLRPGTYRFKLYIGDTDRVASTALLSVSSRQH